MKILFECEDGSYVVEMLPKRLYAKVDPQKSEPVYDDNFSLMLNPGSFKEYKASDPMLETRLEKVLSVDIKKAMK